MIVTYKSGKEIVEVNADEIYFHNGMVIIYVKEVRLAIPLESLMRTRTGYLEDENG